MAKNAIILHGTGTHPDDFWYPWLKENLEQRGYSVWLPQLPNADHPTFGEWLPFVLSNSTITEDTLLIGHSRGSALTLHLLEKIDFCVRQVILVSGYADGLPKSAENDKDTEPLHWDMIGPHAKSFTFINSDNDPWGCTDAQGRIMFDHLGGTQIILHGEGHMGSTTFKQPYKEFPLLLKLID